MTKQELIAKMAEEGKITKAAAGRALDCVVNSIKSEVAAGNKITLVGFGTFEPKKRAARTAHDPSDPKRKIEVPEKTVPGFKAGKAFKEAVAK